REDHPALGDGTDGGVGHMDGGLQATADQDLALMYFLDLPQPMPVCATDLHSSRQIGEATGHGGFPSSALPSGAGPGPCRATAACAEPASSILLALAGFNGTHARLLS